MLSSTEAEPMQFYTIISETKKDEMNLLLTAEGRLERKPPEVLYRAGPLVVYQMKKQRT